MRLSWPETLNRANPFSFLYSLMEIRKIDVTQQEMEIIALCVDMMSGDRNLELLEALLSPADLAAYHTLHDRVCRW
jgi:hypothetical protein